MNNPRQVLKYDSDKGYQEATEELPGKKIRVKYSYLSQATEIGFTIALPIALGAIFGLWIDNKFHSQPKFTLGLLFIGIFISFMNLFVLVKEIIDKKK